MTLENTTHDALKDLGFSLVVQSGPTPEVRDGWPCIAYSVTLQLKGKEVITMPYSLGVGHVKLPKDTPMMLSLTHEETSMLHAWQCHPHAQFQNKALQAQVASKLAKFQHVKPQLSDVLHSLLSDGEAHFSSESFADWCGNLGYSADSIKAKEIFETCDQIGRTLKRNIPENILRQAQTILRIQTEPSENTENT